MTKAVIRLLRRTDTRLKDIFREVVHLVKKLMWSIKIVPRPFRIQIDITDRCNFRCPTCSKWHHAEPSRELKSGEWKTIFEKTANLTLLHEVSITGGEPLVREDIFDILFFAKEKGFYTVLISNGALLERNVLVELAEIGVDRLMISLNSLEENIHDESRGIAGSFRHIMDLIELWGKRQQEKIDICLETVVMESNCDELSGLAEFARERNLNGIIFQVLAPEHAHYSFAERREMPETESLWYENDSRWVKSGQLLRREVDSLLRLKKKRYPILNTASQLKKFPLYYANPKAVLEHPCLGVLSTMYIDPFGDIRLCYGYPPVGNALNDDPAEVWKGSKARKVRLESRQCDRLCQILNNNL